MVKDGRIENVGDFKEIIILDKGINKAKKGGI
jgi:hypothetical protein